MTVEFAYDLANRLRLNIAAEYMITCLGAWNGPSILRKMRWAGHMARMGEWRAVCRGLVLEIGVNIVSVDRRIILKCF